MHTPSTSPARRRPVGFAGLVLLSAAIWLVGCERPPPYVPPDARNQPSGDPLSASYRAPPQASTEILEVPETGINLGWGWNSVSGEPVPSVCVEFVEASEPAQTRMMTMSEVSDNHDLMQSMGMSAEASVKAIGVEVNGKAKFARDMHVSRFASNFVMNASVENGVRYAAPVPERARDTAAPPSSDGVASGEIRLTPAALALARQPDPGEFLHRCGHGFVSAVYSGAKLTAVITVDTNSRQEHQKVSAELSGSGWGAKFKGAMQTGVKVGNSTQSLNVSVFQVGGRGDSIPLTTTDVMAKLDTLSATAFDAPKDFHMAVAPYESLANWPPKTLEVDANEYQQVASLWGAYNALYGDVQQVLDAPDKFVGAKLDRASGCLAMVPVSSAVTTTVSYTRMVDFPVLRQTVSIPVLTTTTTTTVSVDAEQIARLERVQDDVQDALSRLRNFAQSCSANDEGCVFPETAFRSAYAYRVQLPVEVGQAAQQTSPEDILQTQVAGPAKRRCLRDPDDPGCQSNAQIADWRAKLGMQLVKYATLEERDAVAERLQVMGLSGEPATCGSQGSQAGPAFSIEPGYPTLWFHPRIAECVVNPAAAPAACSG